MGRGRAKAKQTKVARELKYQSFDMDLTALERELKGSSSDQVEEDTYEVPEAYADLAERYDSDDDGYDGYGDLRKTS
ncbi:DUF3073 domain-containing protein [Mariniluteicoccus endophyticus]